MTYTTLTFGGSEITLADANVTSWSRTQQNQGDDVLLLTSETPMDSNLTFTYGALVIFKINRTASRINADNPSLPASNEDGGATLTFSGGTQFFWGYCIDADRAGDPTNETITYKFVGPYQFFFDRLIFQKVLATYNGVKQILSYQSKITLGLSLNVLTGPASSVPGSTATNLMSIAQQLKEIMMYAQADSAYQQANNGLGWPGTAQFQCDQLTQAVDGVNYDLLDTPSAHVLIPDFAASPQIGTTSASTLPAGSYMLRAPLDAVNAITCREAMQRQLQWLGGIGSPVVWTDHTQSPPQLRVATRDQLATKSLALAGITVRNRIKARTDLIPSAVHFKYDVAGTFYGQPFNQTYEDVAAYISSSLVEGVGINGLLTTLAGASLSSGNQTALQAAGKTAAAIVQTFDFQGSSTSGATCKIVTQALNFSSATDASWTSMFPELAQVSGVAFYDSGEITVTDAVTGATLYTAGAWTGTAYTNRVVDGQIAPWMDSTPGTAGQTVKAIIRVRFAYTQISQGSSSTTATLSQVAYHEKNITVTLTTLSTNTYNSTPVTVSGEPLPFGLAGYILALESILQYEGSVLVQEAEISDVCPLGYALNITGGRTEWATMVACVQSVRYADNGQTEITFGPAKHLGAAQFVARFRANVGPRWFNLIPVDPLNTGSASSGTQLGNNIPAQAPTNGGLNYGFLSMLGNIASQQTSPDPSGLPQGIHIDAAGGWGGLSAPTGFPTVNSSLVVADGGTANRWVRIALGDLPSGYQAWFQQCTVKNSSGTCVNGFVLMALPRS